MIDPITAPHKPFLAEQRTKLKDILWHLRWLGDLLAHDRGNEGAAFLDFCRQHLRQSSSQAFQDLFVLYVLGEKQHGYFVEFGATDGVAMSNSVLLERAYGWNGIVAEPARIWHERLKANRSCFIDLRCVFERSGETVSFNEAGTGEISAIAAFSGRDGLAEARKGGTIYDVETVSLNDLLSAHNAPRAIDYLSLDTEGSEFEILSHFDFNAYDVEIITVEHNFIKAERGRIYELLTANGFQRRFEELSGFDDWYVRAPSPLGRGLG
jgi:FkbM family methyltransferase